MLLSFTQPFFSIDLALVVKGMIFILMLLYAIFAVRVWVQVRRLEQWLTLLRGHGFGIWALLHVILAVLGLGLTLFIL